jgi:L-lactate dehydrogenase complex protein LldG
MPDSRDHILNSIRRSLSAVRLPPLPVVQASAPGRAEPPPAAALIAQFADELAKLNGQFIEARAADAAEVVARLMRDRDAQRLRAWDAAALPMPKLAEALRGQGLTVIDGTLDQAEAETITVGLTGVEAVLADTGTLAVRAGAGRPRLAWLSVYTHIALFTPEQVYPSLAGWWGAEARLAERVRAGSDLVLITGPSRTADIEMTLTVGVHGPGEVIAVLVQP